MGFILFKNFSVYGRFCLPALAPNVNFWIAYPKVASKIASDLTRDTNWECIEEHSLDAVNETILDNVWTAIRFVKGLKPVAVKVKSKAALVA